MSHMEGLINGLMGQDDKKAYECLKKLEEISNHASTIYRFFDIFVEMLDSDNSYIRTRGLLLIAVNTRWDADNKIDGIIDKYLKCINDERPITARQCIKALPSIVKYKPDLKKDIENALRSANLSRYKENMQHLIVKDIQKTLDDIGNL